jgi:hypothetical protein
MSAKKRKTLSKKICEPYQNEVKEYIEKNTENFLKESEINNFKGYIGQRDGNDWTIKEIGRELQFNHSDKIIEMLTKAYDHYYSLNLNRMIYYIANLIAEEHFSEKQWDRANKFFERISKCYRKEGKILIFKKKNKKKVNLKKNLKKNKKKKKKKKGWYQPLTKILKYSLECSKELQNEKQFISCSIELISDSKIK